MSNDAGLGYVEPTPGAVNQYLDAEKTGRVLNGVEVARQRVTDPTVTQRLEELIAKLETGLARDATLAQILTAHTALLTELQQKLERYDPIQARPSLETRQREGLAFLSGTGKLTLSTTGHLRGAIRNPPSNSRTVFLQHLVLFASAGPTYAEVFINPQTNLPTANPRPANNSRVGSPITSPVEVRVDTHATDALGGGIATGITFALSSGRTVIDLSPLSIPPGVTMGFNAPFAGASDVVMTAYWYEEAPATP